MDKTILVYAYKCFCHQLTSMKANSKYQNTFRKKRDGIRRVTAITGDEWERRLPEHSCTLLLTRGKLV